MANSSGVYQDLLEFVKTNGDPRPEKWFFVYDSPDHVWASTILYLLFVWLGPRMMKERPAFDLRWFMIVYNAFQVMLSLYMVVELLYSTYLNGYNLICQPFSAKTTHLKPTELRMAQVTMLFILLQQGFLTPRGTFKKSRRYITSYCPQ